MDVISIPYSKEEISRIIGKKGKNKNILEKKIKIKIKISDGYITIDKTKSDVNDFELQNIFDAIAMGFNVNDALLLKNPNYIFERINLKLLRPTRRRVIKARIIGKEGKIRKLIEELTDCKIKIYGNYIALIGEIENIEIAKRAIEMLIQGKSHTAMQKWLEHAKTKIEDLKELTERQLKEIE
ncbi:MAG: RNA-processing protein [Candidatus Pacearchaeota archaeon]